jgi:hypothetical protein
MRSGSHSCGCNACEEVSTPAASSTNVFFCPLGVPDGLWNAACSSKMACTQQTIFMELGLNKLLELFAIHIGRHPRLVANCNDEQMNCDLSGYRFLLPDGGVPALSFRHRTLAASHPAST